MENQNAMENKRKMESWAFPKFHTHSDSTDEMWQLETQRWRTETFVYNKCSTKRISKLLPEIITAIVIEIGEIGRIQGRGSG